MGNMASRSRGRWGEDRAAAHLRSLGFEIVARNWRSGWRELPGELDLIARRGDLVVFCEVKARQRSGYGGAAIAVGETKQARIRALAAAWLAADDSPVDADVDVRFDVIAIEGVALTHHAAAF